MKITHALAMASVLSSVACGAAAQVTLSGIKYEETVDLRGSKLQLNGAGIRYRTIIKVYTAGLYLPKKAGTAEAVLGQPGAKRLHIVMLRDVDSSELGKLFLRGVEDNMPRADFAKVVGGLVRMGQLFADQKRLASGESFSVDWVPGTGTVISVKGVPQGEPFKEPEFFNAMLRIWLGPRPADTLLKNALLGQAAASMPGQPTN